MESRRIIVALLAAMAVFYLWLAVASRIWVPQEQDPAPDPTATAPAATAPAAPETGTSTPATAPATQDAAAQAAAPSTVPAVSIVTAVHAPDASPVTLGDAADGSRFPMQIEFQSRGATVSRVKTRGHYDAVGSDTPYSIVEPVVLESRPEGDALAYSFATRLRVDNLELDVPLDQVVWQMDEQTDHRVVWTYDAPGPDGKPLIHVRKIYELEEQAPADSTSDIGYAFEVQNLTDQPMSVVITQSGAIGFRMEETRRDDRKAVAAIWDEGEIYSKRKQRTEVIKEDKHEIQLGADGAAERIAWLSNGNKYFGCIMTPEGRDGGKGDKLFASAEAVCLTDRTDEEDLAEWRQDMTFQFITVPITIDPGTTRTLAFDCYIGPKSKRIFDAVEAYRQRDYYELMAGDFLWCAPAGLVGVMMALLNLFHKIPPGNYGIAIIMLVVVVRAILHPITKKSQVNMMKMQKNQARLKPRLDALKEKYANDRQKLQQETMALYREEGINPAGSMLSCLPMMLQIPIWGALWTALAFTIEMRHAPFDGWWIKDLTQPDALITFSRPIHIPLIGFLMGGQPITSLNLLPILLGISQALQARFMPRGTPGAQDAGSEQMTQQRKMMMFVSVLFVFLLYNAPSGLNLYIMSSNLFGILEQWRVRQHLVKLEARGEDVDAKKRSRKPRKASWFERKWKELEKQADQAKRIESPRKKDADRR